MSADILNPPSKGDSTDAEARVRRRRWPWVVLVAFLAIVGAAAFVVDRYVLDIDQYRDDLIAEIEQATGLPASIGRLELAWLPAPHVNGYDVSVGEGDFMATSARVEMDAELRPLLDRRLNITELRLHALALTVPPDPNDLDARVDRLFEFLNAPGKGKPLLTADVYKVSARDAELWLHGDAEPYLRVTGSGTDILTDNVTIGLEARLVQFGPDAVGNTVFTIGLDEGGTIAAIQGSGGVASVDLAALPYEWAPEASLESTFILQGENLDYISVVAEGAINARETAALTSSYTAEIWWDHGDVTVNDVNWNADGLNFHADATYYEDNRLAIRANQLEVSGDALEYALNQVDREDVRLVTSEGARVYGQNLLIARSPDGVFTWAEGLLQVSGVDLGEANSDEMITRNAKGAFETQDGRIHIRELTGDGFTFAGSVKPDFEANRHSFDINGQIDLASAPLGKIVSDELHEIRGMVAFERIAGTFNDWPEVPNDLVVQGTVRDGAFRYASDEYEDTFSAIDAAFSTSSDGIDSNISASSAKLGPLDANGRYVFDDRTWKGTGSANVPRIVDAFVEAEQRERMQAAVDRYGDSTFEIAVTLASDRQAETRIEMVRRGEPPLRANAVIAETSEGYEVADMNASTRVALADFTTEFPDSVQAAGDAWVDFRRDRAAERFVVDADLSGAHITAGTLIEKAPGIALKIAATGPAGAEAWVLDQVTVHCVGESVAFAVEGERAIAQQVALDVAPFTPLLKDATSATGRIEGFIATGPTELELTLHGVGVHITDALAIDAIDGGVAYRDGYPALRNVTVKGANSSCVINAGKRGSEWSGTLKGKKVDANAFLRLMDELRAFLETDEEAERLVVTADEPFAGQFQIGVDQVYYERGRLDFVRANVQFDEIGIHIRDLSCRPYTGQLTGTVDILRSEGTEQDIHVDVTFENINARIIEDMLLAEPRGLRGAMTGRFALNAPVKPAREAVRRASGELVFAARDGTFGQMGWATRLLTVLRTTEVFALRLPNLRDEGLIYDTCSGKLVMDTGVIRFEAASLKSPSYTMSASGTIDYGLDATNIQVRVEPLESVDRLVSRVPLLRDVVGAATNLVSVPIRITGSPNDLTFGVEEQ